MDESAPLSPSMHAFDNENAKTDNIQVTKNDEHFSDASPVDNVGDMDDAASCNKESVSFEIFGNSPNDEENVNLQDESFHGPKTPSNDYEVEISEVGEKSAEKSISSVHSDFGGENETDSENVDNTEERNQAIEENDSEAKNSSDDDDESMQQKEMENYDDEPGPSKRRRLLLSSDEETNEDDDGDDEAVKKLDSDSEQAETNVGELMTNIFGDASDDDDGDDDEKVLSTKDKADEDEMKNDEDEPEKEWDFDIMLREKKAERRRPRRRRHDGSIDVGGIYDDKIKSLMDAMKVAAKTDRSCNIARKPAVQKRILLPQVKALLIKYDLMEYIIDNGMLNIVAEWLAPLPDKSLPALEIRTTLLKILQEYNRLDQGILKQSGLGKAVMLLYKHPKETKENKILAAKLISEWARPIFHLETDFRSMTKEERIQRDYAQLSAAKRKRLNERSLSNEADKNNEPRVGEKGFIMRARVPRVLGKDYVVRPKNNVEGQFRGATKSRANERLDRAQREFNARTKQNKFRRAIGVSIGGRNIAL